MLQCNKKLKERGICWSLEVTISQRMILISLFLSLLLRWWFPHKQRCRLSLTVQNRGHTSSYWWLLWALQVLECWRVWVHCSKEDLKGLPSISVWINLMSYLKWAVLSYTGFDLSDPEKRRWGFLPFSWRREVLFLCELLKVFFSPSVKTVFMRKT